MKISNPNIRDHISGYDVARRTIVWSEVHDSELRLIKQCAGFFWGQAQTRSLIKETKLTCKPRTFVTLESANGIGIAA